MTQAIPGNPDIAFAGAGVNSTAQVAVLRGLVQTARSERFNIENELLVGRIDSNAALRGPRQGPPAGARRVVCPRG